LGLISKSLIVFVVENLILVVYLFGAYTGIHVEILGTLEVVLQEAISAVPSNVCLADKLLMLEHHGVRLKTLV
jgi:hypothetical protein